jgi:hypothetical protein
VYAHNYVNGWGVEESKSTHRNPIEGHVATPHGYAVVMGLRAAADDGGYWGPCTRIWFLWKGRHYDRTYRRILSRAELVRAAGRFVREVVSGKVK